MATRMPLWQGAELNTYFDIQCRKRELKQHKRRLKHMKSEVNNKPPKRLPHLSSSSSQQSFSDFEYRRIDMENSKLFDRLNELSQKPPRFKTYPRVGSKNVGQMLRNKKTEKIGRENEYLARRLRSIKPTYKKKDWDENYEKHKKAMNERMKRHAVRVHGPRFARKLEERKYCGNHRAYSDIGSEISFETMSEFTESSGYPTSRTATTCTNESSCESSYYRESAEPSTSRLNSHRSTARRSARQSRPTSSHSQKENKFQHSEQSGLQEACFSLEELHNAVNPIMKDTSIQPPPDINPAADSEPDEISDWEDDEEWREQELATLRPGKKHRVIEFRGVKL